MLSSPNPAVILADRRLINPPIADAVRVSRPDPHEKFPSRMGAKGSGRQRPTEDPEEPPVTIAAAHVDRRDTVIRRDNSDSKLKIDPRNAKRSLGFPDGTRQHVDEDALALYGGEIRIMRIIEA